MVKRKTARSRFSRAVKKVADWCRSHLHDPVAAQCHTLGQKLRGHFAYYGITGNMQALQCFRQAVLGLWYKWLRRRHRQSLAWPAFLELLRRWPLPHATVVHSVYRRAANPST